MSKYEKFDLFISEGIVYPLILSLVACVVSMITCVILETEVFWLTVVALVLFAITSIWALLFLVCRAIDQIIEVKESRSDCEDPSEDD